MRILQFFIRSMHPMLPAMISLTLFCGLQSCKTETKEKNTEAEKEEQRQLVEITTVNMDFRMADTIPAGWNNFLYKNQSPQTHFILIDKYPEGKNSEDAEKYVAPVFDKAMKLINEGKTEEGYAEFGNLPEWFGEVVFMGGDRIAVSWRNR